MRKFCFLFIIAGAFNLNAQNNAFVLVDVSGSINNPHVISQARQIITHILGGSLDMTIFPEWEQLNIADPTIRNILTGNRQPLLGSGSFLCIMPFGNRDRYRQNRTIRLNQFPDDLNLFMQQNYPVSYSDSYTYIQIAQAYTALLAEMQNVYRYYIISVTDDLGDQENTSSQNLFDSQEQALILAWNNPNSSRVTSLGSLKSHNFFINFKRVELLTSRGGEPLEKPTITLLTYPGGKQGNELEVRSGMVNLEWNCSNCDPDQKYLVSISSTDGNSGNNIRKTTQSTKYSAALPRGKYKVTVSSANCIPASTYINVVTGGGGFPWLLLLFLMVIAGGYIVWKKRQNSLVRRKLSQAEFDDVSEPVVLKSPRKENEDPEIF